MVISLNEIFILVLTDWLVIQTLVKCLSWPFGHYDRDCYMSGRERWRKRSDRWVSHLSDKCLLKVSIVARWYVLIIIRATSGLHIPSLLATCFACMLGLVGQVFIFVKPGFMWHLFFSYIIYGFSCFCHSFI